MITKQESLKAASSLSPIEETEGLSPHEVAVLVVLMENRWSSDFTVYPRQVIDEVKNAGFTTVAARLGLTSLVQKGMIEIREDPNPDFDPVDTYVITDQGVGWLLKNQDKLVLRTEPQGSPYAADIEPGDLPF